MSLPPSYNLLSKYPNKYFVESGLFRGDSVALALDAGFENIISIELFEEHIIFCKNRFPDEPRITYIHGDSALVLWDTIKDINEQITFLLDAHSQLLEGEPETEHPFPLLKELEQISRHHVKTSTILIDDILILSHPDITGWNKRQIELSLLGINPHYKISYIANPVRGNFLIAEV